MPTTTHTKQRRAARALYSLRDVCLFANSHGDITALQQLGSGHHQCSQHCSVYKLKELSRQNRNLEPKYAAGFIPSTGLRDQLHSILKVIHFSMKSLSLPIFYLLRVWFGFFFIGWEVNWAGSATATWKSSSWILASKVLREHLQVQYKQAKGTFAKLSNKCEEKKIALCKCWQATSSGMRAVPVFLSIFLSNF